MKHLQMTEAKAGVMSEIEDLALAKIKQALNGETDADAEDVKIAVKVLSTVSKNRQTVMHRDAVEFGMAQFIADDEGLAKYIAVTNPQIQKAISGNVQEK